MEHLVLGGQYGATRDVSVRSVWLQKAFKPPWCRGVKKNGCLIAVKTIIYIAVLFANWFPIYESPGKGNALK